MKFKCSHVIEKVESRICSIKRDQKSSFKASTIYRKLLTVIAVGYRLEINRLLFYVYFLKRTISKFIAIVRIPITGH